MAGLRLSLARLHKMRSLFEKRLGAASRSRTPSHRTARLRQITDFGSNPGNLQMLTYVPDDIASSPALVVALHGCTQTASAYDQGTGWSELADRLGFAVVYPEQQAANNPKTCFSWFLPGDTARDSGEALSIRQMIERAIVEFGVDRSRVFVTGLSAGGAMASVMLATYPEVFAGGAIIAGLPYGSAASVQEAFEAMFSERAPSSRALGDQVRAASKHRGPWPKISVWHGTADAVVKPSNAEHIVKQWLNVQGLSELPSSEEHIGYHIRRAWNEANGDTRMESFTITGMQHGVPLATADVDSFGEAGPFFLEAGLSSTCHIAQFWGLSTANAPKRQLTKAFAGAGGHSPTPAMGVHLSDGGHHGDRPGLDPGAVIAAAFQAAGLPVPANTHGRSGPMNPGSVIEAALKAAGLKRS